jgi:hypothetical protein
MPAEKIVYHYCSSETFLSIISGRTLRIGYARFMNDPGEMKWADALINSSLRHEFANLHVSFESDSALYPYIVCFSTRRDIDSQWQRYGDQEHGFAIGFDINAFDVPEIVERSGFSVSESHFGWANVVYEKEEQLKRISAAFEHWKSVQDPDRLKKKADLSELTLRIFLQRVAVFLKSPDFASESEVRLILYPSVNTMPASPFAEFATKVFADILQHDAGIDHDLLREQVRFRATRDVITPFFEMELHSGSIKEIVVGKRNKTEKGSLILLLERNGFQNVRQIPA